MKRIVFIALVSCSTDVEITTARDHARVETHGQSVKVEVIGDLALVPVLLPMPIPYPVPNLLERP